jgi:shikimate kinase
MIHALTKNILITGHAGSGKSFLQAYLKAIDVPAYDMDALPQIAQWVDKAGNAAAFPANADESWFKNHRYVWNREGIKTFLQTQGPCVLLGLSDDDAAEFKDVFDVIAYLKVPARVLEDRLASRENVHGKTHEQRERVLKALADFDAKAERNGYILLDATRSAKEIWKNLTNEIEARF